MIQILKAPDSYSLAGNDVSFQLLGNRVIYPGRKAVLLFVFQLNHWINPGDTCSFSWLNGSVSLSIDFVSNPVPGGYQFKSGPISPQWITDFLNFLFDFYAVSSHFHINHSSHTLVANLPGAAFDISFSSSNSNLSASQLFFGINPIIISNYRITIQTFADNTLLGEDSLTSDSSGKVSFNIADYLRAHHAQRLTPGIFTPDLSSAAQIHANFSSHFFIRFAEVIDGVMPVSFSRSNSFISLPGGLSNVKLAQLADASASFNTLLQHDKLFLTWSPDIKSISIFAPERLYYFKTSPNDFTVMIRYRFADSTTVLLPFTLLSGPKDSLFELNIQHSALPVFNSQILSFQVWVADLSGNIHSNIKSFIFNHRHFSQRYFFVFRNSLGVFDCAEMNGMATHSTDFIRTSFTNNDDYAVALTNIATHSISVNSGSISLATFQWMADLLLSRQVFWWYFNQLIPITITTTKSTPLQSGQRRFNLSFSFQLSHPESFYSTTTPISDNRINPSVND